MILQIYDEELLVVFFVTFICQIFSQLCFGERFHQIFRIPLATLNINEVIDKMYLLKHLFHECSLSQQKPIKYGVAIPNCIR